MTQHEQDAIIGRTLREAAESRRIVACLEMRLDYHLKDLMACCDAIAAVIPSVAGVDRRRGFPVGSGESVEAKISAAPSWERIAASVAELEEARARRDELQDQAASLTL